jgi:hypothetical protein
VRTHEQYEELCAQVAVGRLSRAEWAELEEHLQTCAACRQAAGGFYRLGVDKLPSLSHLYGAGRVPSGMKERVLARAQTEGLSLGPQIPEQVTYGRRTTFKRPAVLWAAWAASIVLAVLATTIALEQSRKRHERTSQTRATPVVAPRAPAAPDAAATRPPVLDDQALRAQLHSVEAQLAVASEQLKQHQRDSESAKMGKNALISRIALLEKSNGEMEAQRNAEIAQLKQDLERVRSEEAANRTASLVSEAELGTLRTKVEQQRAQLDAQRRLIAAEQAAKDLIASRNLHLVDIHEWDENGNLRREFGRVFYAEGQKLEFYAFDLGGAQRPNAKIAYYVWAETPGTGKRKNPHIVPLGKFSLDNAKDNRWALIVTDARLLTSLSSVFVTAESAETTANKPTGKKILSASLDRKANHP